MTVLQVPEHLYLADKNDVSPLLSTKPSAQALTKWSSSAVVLIHDAVLVTRNVRDFKGLPNLQLEDWSRAVTRIPTYLQPAYAAFPFPALLAEDRRLLLPFSAGSGSVDSGAWACASLFVTQSCTSSVTFSVAAAEPAFSAALL